MKQLLDLKAEYKQQTGKEYKPGQAPSAASTAAHASPAPPQSSSSPQAQDLYAQVTHQGEQVRKLKAEKAPKVLLSLHIYFDYFCNVKLMLNSKFF